MYKLLMYVFGISYISIKKMNNNNFSQWSKSKNTFNLLINKQLIVWMKYTNSEKSKLCNQYIIDAIIEMVFIHYRQRVSIYTLLERIFLLRRNLFIQISLIFLFLGLFGKLLRELLFFIYKYKSDVNITKIVNLSLNFPQHSFSITDRKDSPFFYSFGEYLNKNYPETLLFSIGEYIRHSKKFEKNNSVVNVCQLKRRHLVKQKNFLLFLPKIFKATIFLLIKDKVINNNVFFKLIYYRKYFYKVNFMNMLSDVNIELKNIGTIFTLPFADIGLMKYDDKFSEKVLAFSYSQNALKLPSPNLDQLDKQKDFFKYMPLYHLQLNEKAYGFTSLYLSINKVKQKLNDEFLLNFPIRKIINNEIPITLGYEKLNFIPLLEKKLKKQKIVSIFDLAPDSNHSQILRSTNGDKVNGYDFIEKFIIDTIQTFITSGFIVITKPKYSLTHSNDRYGNLLKDMKKKYKDKLIIADPYLRIDSIVKVSCASVNIPYTSTKIIFEKNNIPSIYYVPQKYKQNFTINGATNIKYGLSSLTSFINRIDLK